MCSIRIELRQRVATERAVDLLRQEPHAHLDERRGDRIDHLRIGEQHLERVRIGAQRLAHRFAELPELLGAIFGRQIERRIDQSGRPRERQHEHTAPILVGGLVREAPRARADDRVDRNARPQLVPRGGAPLRVASDPELAWRDLDAEIHRMRVVEKRHVDALAIELGHATIRTLRPPIAIDERRDFGADRQRHRRRIEIREPTDA